MQTASAEALIHAPIQKVWEVMMDLPNYKDWNPFTPQVDCPGGAKVGAPIKLHVRWGDGSGLISPEKIVRMDAPSGNPARAVYAYNFGTILSTLNLVRSHRQQILEEQPDGTTLYRTHIEMTGLFSGFTPLAKVQDGFNRQTAGLKKYCESRKN